MSWGRIFRHVSSLHCFCVSSRQARQVLSLSSHYRCYCSDCVVLSGLSKVTQLLGGKESSWPPSSFPKAQFCCPGALKYFCWFSCSSHNHLFLLFEHFLKVSIVFKPILTVFHSGSLLHRCDFTESRVIAFFLFVALEPRIVPGMS